MKKKIVFILNPKSGTKKKAAVPQQIEMLLDKERFEHTIAVTERAFHAHELAKGAAEAGVSAVIAIGGDGTVNEVASGLIYTNTALGIIPFGSGNGLARHLGIPMDCKRAIELLNTSETITIDGGEVNSKPFFCTAGLGFDAHIGKLIKSSAKRGLSMYVKTVFNEYFNFKPEHYKIRVSGKQIERECFVLTLANAGQYGNNAYISPNADIQDDLLDLCMMKPFPFYKTLAMGMRLFNKSMHQSKYMEILKVKEASIECVGADCMHLDGEYIPVKGKIEVRSLPKCLKVIVPNAAF